MKQKRIIMEMSRDAEGTPIFEIRVKGEKPVTTVKKYQQLAMHEVMVRWMNANGAYSESSQAAVGRMRYI